MKLLLLDYLRRKWWILAAGAALELALGWATALCSGSDQLESGARRMILVFQFQIALFVGMFMNSFELQRGLARVVAALPVSAMQAGRAWWLSSVGLPAIALAVPLFLGAGLFDLLHPRAMFPARSLALTSVYTLLGLGSLSTAVFGQTIFFILALRGRSRNAWSRARWIGLANLACILIPGGAFLLIVWDFSPGLFTPHVFAGAGALLTIAGWFGAGQFVRAQAGFRPSALQSESASGQRRPSAGYGGLALLIGAVFVRCFLIGLVIEIFTLLYHRMILHSPSWRAALEPSASSANMIGMFMTLQLIPGLLHLRFLRTLPVSATRLAALMISLVLLPIVAQGAATAGLTGMALRTPAALMVLDNFALILIPGAFCLSFVVWQGFGTLAIAMISVTFTLSEFLLLLLKSWSSITRSSPLSLTGAVAAGSVLLAFLLTRRSLLRSSRPYRIQPSPFGHPSWGAGR